MTQQQITEKAEELFPAPDPEDFDNETEFAMGCAQNRHKVQGFLACAELLAAEFTTLSRRIYDLVGRDYLSVDEAVKMRVEELKGEREACANIISRYFDKRQADSPYSSVVMYPDDVQDLMNLVAGLENPQSNEAM